MPVLIAKVALEFSTSQPQSPTVCMLRSKQLSHDCRLQEAEGTDEDIDRAIQRALQRAIAAEAALAAAVVAGEIDLTAAERDEEEDQATAADAAADDQPEQAGPSRGAARTRRSVPLPTDDDADMEVKVSPNSRLSGIGNWVPGFAAALALFL